MKANLPQDFVVQQAAPYTVLAQLYDRLMFHVNYRRWAKYILKIIKSQNLWPNAVLLDVGCGTGKFLREIGKLNQPGDGCDRSQEMLKIARQQVPNSQFYHSALPDLSGIPPNTYQIFTCLYDTMNYLLEESSVALALNHIYVKLKVPGILIFDMVSQHHCKHYFQKYVDSEVLSKGFAYQRESYYDEKENLQFNWIRIFSPNGVFEEMHQQKIYHFGTIKKIIKQRTPFELARCLEDFSFEPATSKSGRAHFVLKKN